MSSSRKKQIMPPEGSPSKEDENFNSASEEESQSKSTDTHRSHTHRRHKSKSKHQSTRSASLEPPVVQAPALESEKYDAEILALENEKRNLSVKVKVLEKNIEELDDALDVEVNNHSETRRKLESATKKNESLTSEVNKLKNTQPAPLVTVKPDSVPSDEVKKLQKKLDQKKQTIAEFKETKKTLEDALATAKNELHDANEKIKRIEKNLADKDGELSKAQDRIRELETIPVKTRLQRIGSFLARALAVTFVSLLIGAVVCLSLYILNSFALIPFIDATLLQPLGTNGAILLFGASAAFTSELLIGLGVWLVGRDVKKIAVIPHEKEIAPIKDGAKSTADMQLRLKDAPVVQNNTVNKAEKVETKTVTMKLKAPFVSLWSKISASLPGGSEKAKENAVIVKHSAHPAPKVN